MSEMITLEVHFFLGSFLSGIVLLAAYDVLRLWRRLAAHGRVWVNIEDLLFWLLASVFIFRVIYRLNNGIIREFGILCMAAGMLLYHFTLSEPLLHIFTRILGTIFYGIAVVGGKFAKIGKKGLKKAGKPVRMMLNAGKKIFWRKHENGQESKEKRKKE